MQFCTRRDICIVAPDAVRRFGVIDANTGSQSANTRCETKATLLQ